MAFYGEIVVLEKQEDQLKEYGSIVLLKPSFFIGSEEKYCAIVIKDRNNNNNSNDNNKNIDNNNSNNNSNKNSNNSDNISNPETIKIETSNTTDDCTQMETCKENENYEKIDEANTQEQIKKEQNGATEEKEKEKEQEKEQEKDQEKEQEKEQEKVQEKDQEKQEQKQEQNQEKNLEQNQERKQESEQDEAKDQTIKQDEMEESKEDVAKQEIKEESRFENNNNNNDISNNSNNDVNINGNNNNNNNNNNKDETMQEVDEKLNNNNEINKILEKHIKIKVYTAGGKVEKCYLTDIQADGSVKIDSIINPYKMLEIELKPKVVFGIYGFYFYYSNVQTELSHDFSNHSFISVSENAATPKTPSKISKKIPTAAKKSGTIKTPVKKVPEEDKEGEENEVTKVKKTPSSTNTPKTPSKFPVAVSKKVGTPSKQTPTKGKPHSTTTTTTTTTTTLSTITTTVGSEPIKRNRTPTKQSPKKMFNSDTSDSDSGMEPMSDGELDKSLSKQLNDANTLVKSLPTVNTRPVRFSRNSLVDFSNITHAKKRLSAPGEIRLSK
ncbi:hypothetical protein DICPUDRAFT_81238 [Dictyostelium purpureum]|uniref:Uncharacterized protein n=1 Tax=Dictyostelium purpureum TaxID=5786 RepID=F0ZSW4_DICPU|nr:uncharacterized protein DICPUDRAFT_81238 [Dictyostelium purpureum]EGC32980.1 hypothetical protein DICPUDRAFT_81238 [Dictyostelium purpureum]|eukprot:XP_003290498.1 hypothetical protein DICPUDRAFT_81238 [Dictyostelium purpureum]